MTRKLVSLLLAPALLFQLVLALCWMRIDQTPPYWDEAWYMYQGAVQYDALRLGDLGQWWRAWTEIDRQRPSLVPLLTTPFYALGGVAPDVGLLVNLVALPCLILATYGLGAALADRPSALLAAIVVGSYPVIIGLTHILMVELTMTALVALTLLALWRSQGFLQKKWSLATGALIGLGMLTKVFYPIFVIGPALVMLVGGLKSWPEQSRRRWLNLLLSGLVALAIAGSWYLHNITPMLARSVDATVGVEAHFYGPSAPFSPTNLLRYFLVFVETRVSWLGFLLFLIGLLGLWRKERGAPSALFKWRLLFLSSSIVIGYGFFTSIPNQEPKHLVGIMPAMALLTGWGIRKAGGRYWGLGLGLVYALLVLNTVAGVRPALLADVAPSLPLGSERIDWFYPAQPALRDSTYAAPDPRPWPLDEVLTYALFVADLAHLPRDDAHIGIIPNTVGVEEHAFRYAAYRRKMPVEIYGAHPLNLQNQDVLIHKSGDPGLPASLPLIQTINELLAAPDAEFHLMPPTFALPDGSEIVVYARQPSPLLLTKPSPRCVVDVVFAEASRLVGVDLGWIQTNAVEQRALVVTYYWESLQATARPATLFVHLLAGQNDQIIMQDDHSLFPQTYPSTLWQRGKFLVETRVMELPLNQEASSLRLRVGLYDEQGRFPISAPAAQVGADFVDLCPYALD